MNRKPYWPNNTIYFLTGSTFLHYPYFKENEQKQIVLNQIQKVKNILKNNPRLKPGRNNILLHFSGGLVYSIAINHYHLKFYLENGLLLAKIKQIMHGGTTFEYRKRYKMNYKYMWQNSKVIRITSEEMDWKVTGYIIGNLLKHREVNTFEELKNNHFSSYPEIVEKYGEEFARELIYSVIDVDENGNSLVDFKELKLKKLKTAIPSVKTG